MEIRKATLKDSTAIAEVLIKSWRHAYKGIMPDELLNNLSLEKRSNGWRKHLESGGEAYVFLEEQKIIGVLEIIQFREDIKKYTQFSEIPVIYLLPKKTGQGIGSKLMNYTIRLLKKRNINKIAIWVLEQNLPAIKFYKKFGFVNSGDIKEHPPTGLIEHLYIKNA